MLLKTMTAADKLTQHFGTRFRKMEDILTKIVSENPGLSQSGVLALVKSELIGLLKKGVVKKVNGGLFLKDVEDNVVEEYKDQKESLEGKIIEFLAKNSATAASVAKAVIGEGAKKKEVNPTLYSMKARNLVDMKEGVWSKVE